MQFRLYILLSSLAFAVASSTLPGVVNGWNTSVGTTLERPEAAKFFGVTVSTDESHWRQNSLTPFVGKTFKMTGITIIQRNSFNSLIQLAVKTGTVLWTVEPGYPSSNPACGPMVEHINGGYSGIAFTAGFVSPTVWIENDNKNIFGHKLADDWGIINVTHASDTTLVMHYWSYQKAKFIMTWTLQSEHDTKANIVSSKLNASDV